MKTKVAIFSFGYWGQGGDGPDLKRRFLTFNQKSRGRGLYWVDLRISHSVRSKDFSGDRPRQVFGNRNYLAIEEFGNTEILDGSNGVKIKDYQAGFQKFLKVVEQAKRRKLDLILFCACRCVSYCHRNNIMKFLQKRFEAHDLEGVELLGEFPTMRYRHYFDRPQQETAFNKWRKTNPTGFFLNCTPDWTWMLHRSGCDHFGSTNRTRGEDNWSVTGIPKLCLTDSQKLKQEAKKVGAEVRNCSTCI